MIENGFCPQLVPLLNGFRDLHLHLTIINSGGEAAFSTQISSTETGEAPGDTAESDLPAEEPAQSANPRPLVFGGSEKQSN